MKYSLVFCLLLFSAIAFGQVPESDYDSMNLSESFTPGDIEFHNGRFYSVRNGQRLSDAEIGELEAFGLDVNEYFHLRKLKRLFTVSSYMGMAFIAINSGFAGGQLTKESLPYAIVGLILAAGGLEGEHICNKKINVIVSNMETGPKLSMTGLGVGIIMSF